jgi:hypothetical protein
MASLSLKEPKLGKLRKRGLNLEPQPGHNRLGGGILQSVVQAGVPDGANHLSHHFFDVEEVDDHATSAIGLSRDQHLKTVAVTVHSEATPRVPGQPVSGTELEVDNQIHDGLSLFNRKGEQGRLEPFGT